MRKTILLLMAVSLPFFILTSCSDDDDNGGSGSNNPEKLVVTGNATDITAIGATISGWANIDPAYAETAKFGIIVSEDSKPSYSNGTEYRANELNSDKSYHVEVTGLTPGTKYYYLSYVRIGENYTYGDVKSFSTKEFPKDMSITGDVTDITLFGATISAWANIDPAYAATAKFGVIISEDSNPSSYGTEYRANELNSDNSYHVEVTGLTPGTKYYYLSYVRIGENYTYGDVKSFSTKEFPKDMSITGDVTDITLFGATISAWANIDPAYSATAKFGVIISEDSNPSSYGTEYRANELNSDNSYHVEVTGLTPGTKYYYLSYVRIGENYTYGDVKSFSTKEVHSCPDNHHPHAIDLGLPSGTKWCCCNVGATTPEGYGGYYAWGETSEKSDYYWGTYAYGSSRDNCQNIGSDIAGTQYDVAHVRMGGSWRMPSREQLKELGENSTRTWTSQNGVSGILVTGKNGGQIFLPAAGYRSNDDLNGVGSDGNYCSSSLSLGFYGYADVLGFDSDHWSCGYVGYRCYGRSVRAVCP